MLKGTDLWKANAIVFIGGACTMIIELVAGRILAPYVGVSLYTWTSIIGVVLAGISLGNYLGGKVADRWASSLVLGAIFFAGGLTTITILPITAFMGGNPLPITMHIMDRIVLYTFVIFFLPACILGMVTPMVIKLTLKSLGETGGTVGTIYAYSCVGSIAGTFATGFLLVSWFGTRTIIWMVAAILIAVGILASASWKSAGKWSMVIIVIGLFSLGFNWRDSWQAPCLKESNYFCIKVDDTTVEERNVKALSLDHLVHSYVALDDPLFQGYGYEKIFAEITQYVAAQGKNPLRALFIGGGGYSFPRYLEVVYPGSLLEVVEIDPAVTQVVYDELGLPQSTTIKTYNMDGRIFLIDRPPGHKYHIIVGDAFNDLSVPYHLTTLEFDKMVKAILEDDGIYMANIIDDYQGGQFLRSYMYTLKQTYKYIYLFGIGKAWEGTSPSTYVVAASDRPINMDELKRLLNQGGKGMYGALLEQDKLEEYLAQNPTLLTDDYAPVDNMIAPLFARQQ